MIQNQPSPDQSETRKGVIAALFTYGLWGVLPLLFHALEPAGAVLIVAERTLWSLVLLALVIALSKNAKDVVAVLSDWRRMRVIALSAILLVGNWLLYVWAIATGQVLEASFGYFI